MLIAWARYLEGDNILTKIGSGQDRDRNGHPDFLTNWDRGGQPHPSRNSGHVGMPNPEFSSIFPGLFRLKKSGNNRGKSRKIRDNHDFSRLTLKILKN